jgi:hypothetical protein
VGTLPETCKIWNVVENSVSDEWFSPAFFYQKIRKMFMIMNWLFSKNLHRKYN